MADISDTLAALSEAATQGLVSFDTDRSHFDTACVVAESGDVAANYYRRDADAHFVVALWNAYRTGQLVPVPSVEVLARAMAEQANDYDGDVLQWQCWADSATAVIAAMQEGRE